MAYNTAKMITDADGKLIPQMYDPVTDTYKPLTPDAYNNINVNSGSLSVDNFPATQQVNGSVQLSGSAAVQGDLANVATAGTAVQLPDVPCREITVIARKGNTGSIYVGGSTVSSTSFGVELEENESFTFAIENANLLYIDAEVSGEGISYVTV